MSCEKKLYKIITIIQFMLFVIALIIFVVSLIKGGLYDLLLIIPALICFGSFFVMYRYYKKCD